MTFWKPRQHVLAMIGTIQRPRRLLINLYPYEILSGRYVVTYPLIFTGILRWPEINFLTKEDRRAYRLIWGMVVINRQIGSNGNIP